MTTQPPTDPLSSARAAIARMDAAWASSRSEPMNDAYTHQLARWQRKAGEACIAYVRSLPQLQAPAKSEADAGDAARLAAAVLWAREEFADKEHVARVRGDTGLADYYGRCKDSMDRALIGAPEVPSLHEDVIALEAAQEIALMWGHDRSQFVSKIQVRILSAIRDVQNTVSPPALQAPSVGKG